MAHLYIQYGSQHGWIMFQAAHFSVCSEQILLSLICIYVSLLETFFTIFSVAFFSTQSHLADLNTLGDKITPLWLFYLLLILDGSVSSSEISLLRIHIFNFLHIRFHLVYLSEQSSLICNQPYIKTNTTPVTCVIPQYSSYVVLITCSGWYWYLA